MTTKKRFVKWLWWTTLWVVWWIWKAAVDWAIVVPTLWATWVAAVSDILTWKDNSKKVFNSWMSAADNMKSKIHDWLTSLALDEEDEKNIENWIIWWEISAIAVPAVTWLIKWWAKLAAKSTSSWAKPNVMLDSMLNRQADLDRIIKNSSNTRWIVKPNL